MHQSYNNAASGIKIIYTMAASTFPFLIETNRRQKQALLGTAWNDITSVLEFQQAIRIDQFLL